LFGFHSPNPKSPKNYENNSNPELLENFPMSLSQSMNNGKTQYHGNPNSQQPISHFQKIYIQFSTKKIKTLKTYLPYEIGFVWLVTSKPYSQGINTSYNSNTSFHLIQQKIVE
jgi:hypothetical protein